jgi:cyclic pyranopterin phosphate synthase
VVDKGPYAGPSQDFRIPGSSGTIGVISPVFGHFCANCNRIRITSRGKAKGCLFSDESIDLKPCLRPFDRAELSRQLRKLVAKKPRGHAITVDGYEHKNFVMCAIGG